MRHSLNHCATACVCVVVCTICCYGCKQAYQSLQWLQAGFGTLRVSVTGSQPQAEGCFDSIVERIRPSPHQQPAIE